jgi:hypothetical protein
MNELKIEYYNDPQLMAPYTKYPWRKCTDVGNAFFVEGKTSRSFSPNCSRVHAAKWNTRGWKFACRKQIRKGKSGILVIRTE